VRRTHSDRGTSPRPADGGHWYQRAIGDGQRSAGRAIGCRFKVLSSLARAHLFRRQATKALAAWRRRSEATSHTRPRTSPATRGASCLPRTNVLNDLVIELRRGLDQEDVHGEQEPWIPAEHPLGWCLTGWGSARDAASFFLPSTLARFGPFKSEARPCGVDAADPGPSSSLSPGPPARFPSGSDPGQPGTSAKRRAAVSADRWSLHVSGRSVMVPGAFTVIARSGSGQP
jgi:hypothetical protein